MLINKNTNQNIYNNKEFYNNFNKSFYKSIKNNLDIDKYLNYSLKQLLYINNHNLISFDEWLDLDIFYPYLVRHINSIDNIGYEYYFLFPNQSLITIIYAHHKIFNNYVYTYIPSNFTSKEFKNTHKNIYDASSEKLSDKDFFNEYKYIRRIKYMQELLSNELINKNHKNEISFYKTHYAELKNKDLSLQDVNQIIINKINILFFSNINHYVNIIYPLLLDDITPNFLVLSINKYFNLKIYDSNLKNMFNTKFTYIDNSEIYPEDKLLDILNNHYSYSKDTNIYKQFINLSKMKQLIDSLLAKDFLMYL